jgi:hypothetical protein
VGDNLEDWEDFFLKDGELNPEFFGELEPDEADRMAEAEAQANLGISFVEFRKRWFRGDYKDDPRPEVTSTAFWIEVDDDWEPDCD